MSESIESALSVGFIGVLVRRQFKPGQPYVQLVFESSGRTLLALSRNVSLVRSLQLGRCYRVSGTKHIVGGKSYLLEPQFVPLPAKPRTSRRARYAAFAAGSVLLLASGGVVAGLGLQGGDSPKASSATWHAGPPTEESATVSVEPEKTTPAPSTTPTPTGLTIKPATTTNPKSANSNQLSAPTTPAPEIPQATQPITTDPSAAIPPATETTPPPTTPADTPTDPPTTPTDPVTSPSDPPTGG